MEQKKRRPWRRWVVLVLMIAGFILGGIFVPVQPEITVAAEKLIEEPIIGNFLGLGPFYLVNTLPTLAVTIVLLVAIAYFTNRSLKQSAATDFVPRGIGNLMEAIPGNALQPDRRLGRCKVGKGDLPLVRDHHDLCVVRKFAQANPRL